MLKLLWLISSVFYVSASQVDGCIGRAPNQEILYPEAGIDTSNVDLIKQNMTPKMKVKKIVGCDNEGVFKGIEVLLADPET